MRKFLDTIRAEKITLKDDFAAQLVTDGLTPAPILADLLARGIDLSIDAIDSTIQDESLIYNNVLQTGIIIGNEVFVKLTGFTDAIGGDGSFLNPDAVNDQIVTSATAGFTYNISARIAWTGRNNRRHDFAVFMDGVQVGFIASATGDGSAKFLTTDFSAVILSAPVSAVFDLRASGDAPDPLDIASIAFSVVIHATNNP